MAWLQRWLDRHAAPPLMDAKVLATLTETGRPMSLYALTLSTHEQPAAVLDALYDLEAVGQVRCDWTRLADHPYRIYSVLPDSIDQEL